MTTSFKGDGIPLSASAFDSACDLIGVEAARLWAVMEVEALSCGFLEDRRPTILFERHIFHAQTRGRFDKQYPDISNPVPGGYGGKGLHQYDRLERATRLDLNAALRSTSWGLGQVMGFNAAQAGYPDVQLMVKEMQRSEDAQLKGMVEFIKHSDLHKSLRVGNWTSFAMGYNGPRYYINKYDDRLRGSFHKFTSGPLPDLRVRAAQIFLTYQGYDPGLVDGWLGRQTLRALNELRSNLRLSEVSELLDEDLGRLSEIAPV